MNSPLLFDQYIPHHTYTAVAHSQVFHQLNIATNVYREDDPGC